MRWEFLSLYVTDGIGNFVTGQVGMGMYLPAIRVVREFAFQLSRWHQLSAAPSSSDSPMLRLCISFCTMSVSRNPVSGLKKKSWSMTRDVSVGGEEEADLSFSPVTTNIDERLCMWGKIGLQLLAFAEESRAILDDTVVGVEHRRESEDAHLLDVETAKRLIAFHFRGTPWLRDDLLGFLSVDHESSSDESAEEDCIHTIALRSGGGVWQCEN